MNKNELPFKIPVHGDILRNWNKLSKEFSLSDLTKIVEGNQSVFSLQSQLQIMKKYGLIEQIGGKRKLWRKKYASIEDWVAVYLAKVMKKDNIAVGGEM